MNPNLIPSQFETLEEPLDVVTVDVNQPVPNICTAIRAALAI
jgi:gluconate kinase